MGQGLSFDGNDYVIIDDVTDFRFVNESVSFAAWVTLTANDDNWHQFVSLANPSGLPQITLAKGRSGWLDGQIYFQLLNAADQSAFCKSILGGDQLPLGECIHVVGVIDSEQQNVRLYLDGVLQDTTSLVDYDPDASPGLELRIGSRAGGGSFHNGLIDEVRVYEQALTDQEVLDLYNAAGP